MEPITIKEKLDKFWIGAVLGILGALIGFLVFGAIWSISNDVTFNYFYKDVFLGTRYYTDKIITISILLDVVLFFLFMQLHWYNLCKGLLAVVISTVPLVIYFY